MPHTASQDTHAQRFARVAMVKNQGLTHSQINAIFTSQESTSRIVESAESGRLIEETRSEREYQRILIEETVNELKQLIENLKDLSKLREVFLKFMQGNKAFAVVFEPKGKKWKVTTYPDLPEKIQILGVKNP